MGTRAEPHLDPIFHQNKTTLTLLEIKTNKRVYFTFSGLQQLLLLEHSVYSVPSLSSMHLLASLPVDIVNILKLMLQAAPPAETDDDQSSAEDECMRLSAVKWKGCNGD